MLLHKPIAYTLVFGSLTPGSHLTAGQSAATSISERLPSVEVCDKPSGWNRGEKCLIDSAVNRDKI